MSPSDTRPPRETLKVSVRAPYGVETVYPQCETSRLFAELLGQKTLTRTNVETIKRLGFSFEVIPERTQL